MGFSISLMRARFSLVRFASPVAACRSPPKKNRLNVSRLFIRFSYCWLTFAELLNSRAITSDARIRLNSYK